MARANQRADRRNLPELVPDGEEDNIKTVLDSQFKENGVTSICLMIIVKDRPGP